jgi:hypothetical protein
LVFDESGFCDHPDPAGFLALAAPFLAAARGSAWS